MNIPQRKRGSLVIISTSRYGKSVLLKRIMDYKLGFYGKDNPALVIDTQGVDHRSLGEPNNEIKPLFTNYGEYAKGVQDVQNYCPIFASKKAFKGDKIIGISLNDLNPRDLLSCDLGEKPVIEFYKIKQLSENNRRIMDNPLEFYVEFSNLPSTKRGKTISALNYPAGTLVNYGIKDILENKFSWWAGYSPSIEEKPEWMDIDQWKLQKRPPYFVSKSSKHYKPTFWPEYNQKKKVVANFMDAKEEWEGMAIYGGYYLRDAYEYCSYQSTKNREKFGGMTICVEETNLFLDPNDKSMKRGSNYYITELLCRGFKFEVFFIANFQSISSINPEIKNHLTSGAFPVIMGNLTKNDRDFLDPIFPDVKELKLRDKVPNLDWGGKEWAIYYNDRIYDTFVPYPALSRFKVDKQ